MADFAIGSIIVCDDIRTEQNGKNILIGVYGGDILIRELPAALPLAFWIEIQPKAIGEYRFDLRIEVPGPDPQAEMRDIVATATTLEPGIMILPSRPFLIQTEGQLRVQIRASGTKKWKLAKSRGIAVSAPSAASVPG